MASARHQYPYAQREFSACGVPYHERAGRLNESIQLTVARDRKRFCVYRKVPLEEFMLNRTKPIQTDHRLQPATMKTLCGGWRWRWLALPWLIRPRNLLSARKIDGSTQSVWRNRKTTPSALLPFESDGARLRGGAERYFRQPRANRAIFLPPLLNLPMLRPETTPIYFRCRSHIHRSEIDRPGCASARIL